MNSRGDHGRVGVHVLEAPGVVEPASLDQVVDIITPYGEHPPDRAGLHEFRGTPEPGLEPELVLNGPHFPGAAPRGEDAGTLLPGTGQRLLADEVLARFENGDRVIRVRLIRRANGDQVDLRVFEY